MNRELAQLMAKEVSDRLRGDFETIIQRRLKMKALELPPERMNNLLMNLCALAYSEIWQGLAGEPSADEKLEELAADILADHAEFRKALKGSDRVVGSE